MDAIEEIDLAAQLAEAPLEYLLAYDARLQWQLELARPEQMPPEDQTTWDTWLLQAGRAFGKTRSAVEWMWWEAWNDPGSFNHVVVRRSEDLGKIAFEGPSGFFNRMPPSVISRKITSPYEIHLTNGSVILGFSADEPDVLRGPESQRTWCDELAAWRRLDAAWYDGVLFGTRLGSERNGNRPKKIITTTPRPLKFLKTLKAEAGVYFTSGTIYDNAKNLPPTLLEAFRKKFAGTRRGRQELQGELLEDIPGALWQFSWIESTRIWERPRDLVSVVIGVDPPASSNEGSNECGLIAAASDRAGRGYVLADRSDIMSPERWGEAAVLLADQYAADHITIEVNQGGEMCRTVLEAAAQRLAQAGRRRNGYISVVQVRASRGKEIRAEPVSQLYEQRRVAHVGEFPELEDQMTTFTKLYDRTKNGSPDRLDAAVWALTDLLVEPEADLSAFTEVAHGPNRWAAVRPTSVQRPTFYSGS